jgi:hypothetical protein
MENVTTQSVDVTGQGRGRTPDDSQFKTRLAMIEALMGWTNVKEAALACGFGVESYRGWRKGRLPRDITAVATTISEVTGVDRDWIIRGSIPPDGAHAKSGWSSMPSYIPSRLTTAA